MRATLFALCACLMSATLVSAAREKPDRPAPRTRDYDWMSVATWRQRHDANVARAAQGDCDILLLGDSITEGWNQTTLWEERYPHLKIANFGIGGDTTANLLWRLENGEIGALKPQVIVMMIGTNNLGRNEDRPAAVVNGIQAIVSVLHARLPGAKIVLLGVLPVGQEPKTRIRKQVDEMNTQLVKTLHDGHSVFVANLADAVLETDGSISASTMADFLHPTPAGYQRLAEALFPQLERMVGRL